MAVLSIQSHVVFGHAGNSAAVFPLQRLGREAWAINTVEFSNHTGYGSWRGRALGGELASELVTGLEERGVLNRCEAVLSGYLGDAEVAQAVIDAVKRVRAQAPASLYCCDPVMGDVGKGFYVKPDIPGIFKNELIPLADMVTPNQFELEALTGVPSKTINDVLRAVDALHQMGPAVVLVTSFRDGPSAADGGARIGMLASDKSGVWRISTPELPLGPGVAGAGDLTAAVFLSRWLETGDLKRTLELCASSVYGVLEASFHGRAAGAKGPPELLIVQAQEELAAPSHHFEAVRLEP
jgi:pyridoxine kinase